MSGTLSVIDKYPQIPGSPFRRIDNGVQWIFRFPNGYGASVITGSGTYSGDTSGELAVVKWYGSGDDDFVIVYNTPVTDDVLGWQSVEEIAGILDQIRGFADPVD